MAFVYHILVFVVLLSGCELFKKEKNKVLSTSEVFDEVTVPHKVKICDKKGDGFLVVGEPRPGQAALFIANVASEKVERFTHQNSNYRCGTIWQDSLWFASDRDSVVRSPPELAEKGRPQPHDLFELADKRWNRQELNVQDVLQVGVDPEDNQLMVLAKKNEGLQSVILKKQEGEWIEISSTIPARALVFKAQKGDLLTLHQEDTSGLNAFSIYDFKAQKKLFSLADQPVDFFLDRRGNQIFILRDQSLEVHSLGKSCKTGHYVFQYGQMNRVFYDHQIDRILMSTWAVNRVLVAKLSSFPDRCLLADRSPT